MENSADLERKREMLKQIREYYKLWRNTDVAKFFDISDQNAYAWCKRGCIDFEKIYERCPDISPDWLLSGGEGEMLRGTTQTITGNNNTQVGGHYISSDINEMLNKTLESLKEQQSITRTAQEQASNLIGIIKSITSNNPE